MDVLLIISDMLQQFLRRECGGASDSVLRQSGGSVAFTETGTQCKLCKRPEIRQVQFLDWLGHPLLYNDRCLGLTVAENCGSTASAVL